MELYARIIAISLKSNEIEIGGPLFSKIHQMTLGMVNNASNQKTDTTPKNQFLSADSFSSALLVRLMIRRMIRMIRIRMIFFKSFSRKGRISKHLSPGDPP